MAELARILVADDDPDTRDLIAYVLHTAGYDVVTAHDGSDALRVAREQDPDLLVLDVNMPGKDGYQVCRELQALGPITPPVIFLTALDEAKYRVAGLDAGAVDYVGKPFNSVELTARVRAALHTKAVRDALVLQASTDPLTGLHNRRQLDARAEETIALAQRHGRALACLMVDIDHFKRVNDTYGHEAGDVVLREIARRLRDASRGSDVVARYGGEEFMLLLPETDLAGAVAVAEKIRALVAGTPVPLPHSGEPLGPAGSREAAQAVPVHASVGVALWQPSMTGADALYAAADEALYRAKDGGRDRVEVASPSV